MKNILFIVLMFLLAGCHSVDPKYQSHEFKNNQKLFSLNQSISINIPNSFPQTPWKAWSDFREDWFTLDRQLPNMMGEYVRMSVRELSKESMSQYNYELLDKEKSDILEKTILTKPLTDWAKKNHAERRVNYSKSYIDYIDGLRCRTTVESSNIALGVGRKSYQTFCNYYDTHGNPKELWIMHDYMYTHRGTKFKDDESSNNVVTPETMQLQFKKDMKAIFDSLQIHDMDRAKMKELGLLHDRAYEIQEW